MNEPHEWIFYHNPRCSKSRGALELLEQRGVRPRVVEYLKTPLDEPGLMDLLGKLGLPAKDIVRTKEESFAALRIDLGDTASVVKALAQHPELMERPIVVRGSKAVVARPPEYALTLL